MCKETNLTGDFYKPFEDIFKSISSPRTNTDIRLSKLWTDYIGKKIEIQTTNLKNIGSMLQKVSTMFSTDPIAYKLMSELVLYKRDFEKILVKQDYSPINLDGKPNLFGMIEFMKNSAIQPVLVLESGSKFAVIISTNPENDSIIDVYFWELSYKNTHKESKETLAEFWAEITQNKIMIDANVIYRDNIRKNLEKMVTADSISEDLVSELRNYKPKMDTLTVRQMFTHFKPGKQNLADMTYFLKNIAINPVIVMSNNSKFIAVISQNQFDTDSVHLHIWDLSNCI